MSHSLPELTGAIYVCVKRVARCRNTAQAYMKVYGSRQLSTIIDAIVDERAYDGVAYDLRGYRVEPDAPGIVITASGKRLNR